MEFKQATVFVVHFSDVACLKSKLVQSLVLCCVFRLLKHTKVLCI